MGAVIQDLSKAVDFLKRANLLLLLFLNKDIVLLKSAGQAAFCSDLTLTKGTWEKKHKEGGPELNIEKESILLK